MRDKPHPNHKLEWPGGIVPEWARPKKALKRFGKKGGKSAGKRERLQKVMAQSGYGSRRNIEILIAQGHLTINGEVAKLGDQVGPGDKVKLDGRIINLRYGAQMPRVLMYHKPDNEIVTRDDPEGRATVFDKLPKVNNGRWVSVGRLDLNTSGLLLFTTNGELANKMTHPRFEVEREYAVRVMGEVTDEQRERFLKTGVDIEGESCTFDSIEDRGGEGSNHWYHVVLREGKNREVRKMFEAVGLMVSRLMRVRFGNVELPSFLKRGMWREMDEDQVSELMAFAGMNESEEGEEESSEEEEDENDNIGNRFDAAREAKQRPPEIEDDIGNRYDPAREARMRAAPEIDDDIGNRGTYGEGFQPPKQKGGPRGAPGPGGGKKFFKKRERDGNVAHAPSPHAAGPKGHGQPHGQPRHGQGQGHGQGQKQGQGQGKRHKHGKRQGPPHGNAPHGNAPHGSGQQAHQAQGSGGQGNGGNPQQHGPRPQGGGQPHGQNAGQGKPNRNRRNRHRNRQRGANAEGAPAGTPTGTHEPA